MPTVQPITSNEQELDGQMETHSQEMRGNWKMRERVEAYLDQAMRAPPISIPTGVGGWWLVGLGGDISDSLHRQMEGRNVTAFKLIECETALEGNKNESGSAVKNGPTPADADGPCEVEPCATKPKIVR